MFNWDVVIIQTIITYDVNKRGIVRAQKVDDRALLFSIKLNSEDFIYKVILQP